MTRKKFEVPDQQLWEEIKSTISPIKRARRSQAKKLAHDSKPVVQLAKAVELPNRLRTPHSSPPPLAAFERRTAQKLGRGKMEPEARLDLHGENLETARYQLLHFVSSCRMQGCRLVLVITGKGASPFSGHTLHGHGHFHAPERAGKLRREVPLWLEEAQFRIHVVGLQPAHPRHGGGGAFYVRLRKHASEA